MLVIAPAYFLSRPSFSIKGLKLGMSGSQVCAKLGKPPGPPKDYEVHHDHDLSISYDHRERVDGISGQCLEYGDQVFPEPESAREWLRVFSKQENAYHDFHVRYDDSLRDFSVQVTGTANGWDDGSRYVFLNGGLSQAKKVRAE